MKRFEQSYSQGELSRRDLCNKKFTILKPYASSKIKEEVEKVFMDKNSSEVSVSQDTIADPLYRFPGLTEPAQPSHVLPTSKNEPLFCRLHNFTIASAFLTG